MMPKILKALGSLSIGFVLVFLAGCENPSAGELEATSKTQQALTNIDRTYIPMARPAWIDTISSRQARMEVSRQHMVQAGPVHVQATRVWKDTEQPLADRVARIQDIVGAHEGTEYAYLLDQMTAMFLYKQVYAEGISSNLPTGGLPLERDLSAGERDAIAFATEKLVQHGNPNADLIRTSLLTLDDYWTAEERERLSESSQTASLAWIAEQKACEDCAVAPDAGNERSERIRDIQMTVREMESL